MAFTSIPGGFKLSPEDERRVNLHRAITKSINTAFIQVGAVYLTPSGKAPTDDENWYGNKFGDVNLQSWIDDPEQRPLNLGFNLQLGWVDIDIDSEDPEYNQCIIRAMRHLRLDDRFQFGRASMGCATHILVQLPEEEGENYEELITREPNAFKIAGRRFHVQLRSSSTNINDKTGPRSPKQTVVPGSIYTHKKDPGSYDISVWYGRDGIAQSHKDIAATTPRRVNFNEIVRAIAFGTVLYCIRPHWQPGSRQDTAMKIAGWLARIIRASASINNDEVLASDVFCPIDSADTGRSLIQFICDECGDDEAWKRIRVLTESMGKLERNPNSKIPGWPSVKEVVGEECAEAMKTVLTLGSDTSPLSVMADRYLYNEDNNTYIDRNRFKTKGSYNHEAPELEKRHKDEKILVNGKPREAWKIFEQSKLRVKIGMADLFPNYEPGCIIRVNRMGDVLVEEAEDDDSLLVFNTWMGWPVKPVENPNPTLMAECISRLDKVLGYLTRDNPNQIKWVKDWVGFTIQRPGDKQQIAWIVVGGQGTGKSWFGNVFLPAIMGNLAGSATPSSIGEKFSISPFLNKMLIFIDEAKFSGTSSVDDVKKLIRNTNIAGEEKFANARDYRVYARLMMASNRLDVNAGQAGTVDRALFYTRAYDGDHLNIPELEFRQWAECLKPEFESFTKFLERAEVRSHYMRMFMDLEVNRYMLESIQHSSSTDRKIMLMNLSWSQRILKNLVEEGRMGGSVNHDDVVEGGADITALFSVTEFNKVAQDCARRLGLGKFTQYEGLFTELKDHEMIEKHKGRWRFKFKIGTLHEKMFELMGIPMEPRYEFTDEDYGPNDCDGTTVAEWRGRRFKFGKF